MTNRRTPAKRPTKSTTWKPTRARAELVKAIGAVTGVVLLTALLITACLLLHRVLKSCGLGRLFEPFRPRRPALA